MTEPTGETVVIIGGGYWAKGTDLPDAKKNFRKYGGSLSRGYGIVTFDAETEFHGVDDFGRYHWKGNKPTIREVKPRKTARR
jgi:hypothetical protein